MPTHRSPAIQPKATKPKANIRPAFREDEYAPTPVRGERQQRPLANNRTDYFEDDRSGPVRGQKPIQQFEDDFKQKMSFQEKEDPRYSRQGPAHRSPDRSPDKRERNRSPEPRPIEPHSKYPPAINDLLSLCLKEVGDVQEAFKGRARQQYLKMFQSFGDKLSDRDYAIIRGATGYLYEYSRVRSIDEERALKMMGIHEIPASQIAHYTSKATLEKIAKSMGLSYSGKKAEILVKNIRSMLSPTY